MYIDEFHQKEIEKRDKENMDLTKQLNEEIKLRTKTEQERDELSDKMVQYSLTSYYCIIIYIQEIAQIELFNQKRTVSITIFVQCNIYSHMYSQSNFILI